MTDIKYTPEDIDKIFEERVEYLWDSAKLKNGVIVTDSFNRTFMELKCVSATISRPSFPSFNRTFMELKYSQSWLCLIKIIVLIVPLWN